MNTVKNIYRFYRDGFRRMDRLGRLLWGIVLVKLAVMFLVLKIFFFPNYMNDRFDTAQQKTDYVIEALTGPVDK